MTSLADMPESDFMTFIRAVRRRAELEDAVTVPSDPISVRIPEAIRMIGIRRSKLYELIKGGDIEIIKIGRSTLVIVASLRAFINNQRIPEAVVNPLGPISLGIED